VATLPEIPVDSALARLFRQPRARDETIWFSLPGGSKLFGQGDPSDQLYIVRTGRLGAFRREEGQEPQFLGVIRPGEPAGEMALIAGVPHSADVYALRDSEIFAVPKQAFFEACDEDGAVMTELARLMILRSRQVARRGPVGDPSVFGFVGTGRPGPIRPVVERLEREITALVGAGLSNQEIADRLFISTATAKTHVNRAMMKTGSSDRAQLVVFAYETGLTVPRSARGAER